MLILYLRAIKTLFRAIAGTLNTGRKKSRRSN